MECLNAFNCQYCSYSCLISLVFHWVEIKEVEMNGASTLLLLNLCLRFMLMMANEGTVETTLPQSLKAAESL